MSGIYGFWQPFSKLDNSNDLIRLMLWNKAYGNISEEVYQDDNFYLGCCYEKLSETAIAGSPVLKHNNKFAVIDALIYNREELIKKGQFTDTLSDEELIFSYIEKFGLNELKDVNGDFSGAILDINDCTLTLFRDHMGVRPLFYYSNEHTVTFSTDIRGLVSMPHVDTSIDEKWIWRKFTGDATMGTENTEFAHIFCVPPASYMTFTLSNGIFQHNKTAYWQLGSRKIRYSSEAAYIKHLRELITDAIERRLKITSGAVGAELSGGLDSGVIDILINRLGRDGIYFSWSASPQELPYAPNDERLIIADICKQENITCNYRNIILNFDDESIITHKMRKIGAKPNMSEGIPLRYAFPPYINTLQICKATEFINRQGAKVIFTGHGGDEGVSHRCNPYELFYHKEYFNYIKYMWSSTQGLKHRIYNTLLRCHKNLTTSRKTLRNTYTDIFAAKDLLNKDFYEKYSQTKMPALTFAYDALAYIKNGGSRNRLDVTALLGAYSGARYLIPYLDYRVIDYAVSIPRHMFLKNMKHRYIFREAFKDIMPVSLYNLNSKEDTSWNSIEKKPRDEKEHVERKKLLVGLLDKEYWSKYLNLELIDRWTTQSDNISDENLDKGMFLGISNCVQLQNMIKRSKEL